MSAPVTVLVDGRPVSCERGKNLLHALLDAAVPIATACWGQGTCHLCRVRVVGGAEALVPPTPLEKRALGNVLLAGGTRLACQLAVTPELRLELPPSRKKRGPPRPLGTST